MSNVSISSFLEILDGQAIPWAADVLPRIVVTGSSESELPAGVRTTTRKLRGPRRAERAPRMLDRASTLTARWPADGLIETAGVPILVCTIGGRVDYRVGDQVVHCGAGYFILVPPGVPHDDGSKPHYDCDPRAITPADHCDLLWFNRYGRSILCWTCHSLGVRHRVRQGYQYLVRNNAANQLLDLLIEESADRLAGWRAVCQAHLVAFLTIIRREIAAGEAKGDHLTIGESAPAGTPRDRIEEARQYIRAHLRDALTIEKVARHVYLSRTQFTLRFRQQTGQTFTEFLTACRLEEARTLLRDSTWSITRISRYVGLKSLPYFCALFQRHTGMTPQEFRSQPQPPDAAPITRKTIRKIRPIP